MLLDFSVSNFGPFCDRVTLSMQATSFDEHPENKIDVHHVKNGVLTCAAVFGANSSGKSYLLQAMQALEAMISGIYEPGFRYPWYEPFRLCSVNSEKPIDLEIRLLINGVLYDYSISYNVDSVTSESLYFYPQGRRKRVFDRLEGKGLKKSVTANTSSSSAYITVASKLNDEVCTLVRNSIMSVSVIFPSDAMINYSAYLIENNPNLKGKMIDALNIADFGINDIDMDVTSPDYDEMSKILNQATLDAMRLAEREIGSKIYKLYLRHSFSKSDCDASGQTFPMDIESMGTRQMFSVMGPILYALETGSTVVIDEFGSRLHPLITHWIVELFRTDYNTKGAQLIVNTHDLTLLDIQDLFRRDQIYFTNKDRDYGNSELYSLSDFKGVRLELDLIKSYLTGRFDAVPKIISREGI